MPYYRLWSYLLAVLSIVWIPVVHVDAVEATLRAGAATSNITPPLGSLIVGGFHPFPAQNVHDELHVRSLVLDDGATRLAFVLCDNVGIPREVYDQAKARIEKLTGIPVAHQLMAATHTHSATSARSENAMVFESKLNDYQNFLAQRIVDAVQIAVHRLEPAKIAWGAVDEPSQLFNRRWFILNEVDRRNPFGGVDQVRMNPPSTSLIRPAGPIDPQVSFVAVQSIEGRPIAVLANYSLHYVGGIADKSISADYFAVFANQLGKLLNTEGQDPPFVGIMSNGTSGDVNNVNRTEKGRKYASYEKMHEVGNLIASRVHAAMQSVTYDASITLGAKTKELALQVRKPDATMLEYIEKVLAKPKDAEPFHIHERIYADRVKMLAKSPDEVTIVLQAFRLGSLGITAIPFEVFTEIGLEIKEKSPIQPTFTIELANGSYGYLPSPAQHKLGGYETWLGTNKVEVQASEKIVDELMKLMSDLKTP